MIVTPGSETPPGLLAIEDAERLQGFEVGHTWPCLRAEGLSRDLTPEAHEKARFALVGDAVSVPVAWYIGKRIAHPYNGPKYTSGATDRPFDPAAPEVSQYKGFAGVLAAFPESTSSRVRYKLCRTHFVRTCKIFRNSRLQLLFQVQPALPVGKTLEVFHSTRTLYRYAGPVVGPICVAS